MIPYHTDYHRRPANPAACPVCGGSFRPNAPDICDCLTWCWDCGGTLEGDGPDACTCDDTPIHGQIHEDEDD